jgi:hypothetical protein
LLQGFERTTEENRSQIQVGRHIELRHGPGFSDPLQHVRWWQVEGLPMLYVACDETLSLSVESPQITSRFSSIHRPRLKPHVATLLAPAFKPLSYRFSAIALLIPAFMWTCVIYATRLREQGRAGQRNVEAEGREASPGISARLTSTQLGNSKVTEVGT